MKGAETVDGNGVQMDSGAVADMAVKAIFWVLFGIPAHEPVAPDFRVNRGSRDR